MSRLEGFREVTRQKRFSANARSLYLELNWELGWGWKEISNLYLQERSGIRSANSFTRAREELIEAGLIEYETGKYRMKANGEPEGESQWKPNGNRTEIEWKLNGNRMEKPVVKTNETNNNKKIKKEITTTTTTAAGAQAHEPTAAAIQGDDVGGNLAVNSTAVQAAWFKWEGETLKGGNAFSLIELEKRYGTAKLVEAIDAAGCADRYGRLTVNFIKAVLKRITGGGVKNAQPSKKIRYGGEDNPPKKNRYGGEDKL